MMKMKFMLNKKAFQLRNNKNSKFSLATYIYIIGEGGLFSNVWAQAPERLTFEMSKEKVMFFTGNIDLKNLEKYSCLFIDCFWVHCN